MTAGTVLLLLLGLSGCEWLAPTQPTLQRYLISGGVEAADKLVVDDDIEVLVDDHQVFSDEDGAWTGETRWGDYKGAPIALDALDSSSIRIRVADTCCCNALVGPLYLHREDGSFAQLTPGVVVESRGSCGARIHDEACLYRFFDEELKVSDLEFVLPLVEVSVDDLDEDDDGDTVHFSPPVLGKTCVRYTGIDTPELTPSVECFAEEAKSRNAELVSGKTVWLELGEREVDNVGRLLAYVRTAPTLDVEDIVQYQLLLGGYATIFKAAEDWRYVNEFRDAQIDAAFNRRGLWGECGDYTASDIVIAAIQFWSEDEFVVIINRNREDVDVNLDGWTLSDEEGNTYEFRETTDIDAWSPFATAPSTRVIHSGPGQNQSIGIDRQWTDRYIWNDTGDTAYLKNKNGES